MSKSTLLRRQYPYFQDYCFAWYWYRLHLLYQKMKELHMKGIMIKVSFEVAEKAAESLVEPAAKSSVEPAAGTVVESVAEIIRTADINEIIRHEVNYH